MFVWGSLLTMRNRFHNNESPTCRGRAGALTTALNRHHVIAPPFPPVRAKSHRELDWKRPRFSHARHRNEARHVSRLNVDAQRTKLARGRR